MVQLKVVQQEVTPLKNGTTKSGTTESCTIKK